MTVRWILSMFKMTCFQKQLNCLNQNDHHDDLHQQKRPKLIEFSHIYDKLFNQFAHKKSHNIYKLATCKQITISLVCCQNLKWILKLCHEKNCDV